jgi:hypothetical protein
MSIRVFIFMADGLIGSPPPPLWCPGQAEFRYSSSSYWVIGKIFSFH